MKRQIIDTIEKYDKIIIHRHVRPDPDAYGSQVGLRELIKDNYPEKQVFASGTHDELLDYLAFQDELTKEDYSGALVIVTDTGNTERIDADFYNEGSYIIKIDHHPNVDPYGDLKWVDTGSSSTSEMIYELFLDGQKHSGWKMSDTVARLLFAGIVGDTGRFIFPSATVRTFEIAGELIKYDFDRTKLFADMYEEDRRILHLKGYIYQNFIMDQKGMAYIKIDQTILKEFNVTASETSQLVGVLGDVRGICAWVIFVEEKDQIRVRLRSKGPVINGLAAQYNGGGHPLASGASVYNWHEADEIIEKLKVLCSTN